MKKGTTIKIKIKVKSKKKNLPDWGLGKGILAEQEIVLGETVTEDNKIHYAYKIEEIYSKLVENTIEKIVEVVKFKKEKNK